MPETLFEELKRYVGFTDADGAFLRGAESHLAPHYERISGVFYDRILEHEGARLALVGGESKVGHLKVTLQLWLKQLMLGPWDEAYYSRRARIGRVHVRIALPQHYMFGAMHVLGQEAHEVLSQWQAPEGEVRGAQAALQKLLDVELAIMLHTYREDQQSQQSRAERLSTFGLLVGSVGHELRNPLGVIETSAYILRGNEALTENGRKHVDRIEGQVQLASAIVGKLLEMIQDKPVAPQQVHLESLAREVLTSLRRPDNVAIELHGLSAVPPVQGDAVQIRQVLTNLVQNSIEALSSGGQVRVSAEASPQGVTLHVEDSGPGLPPEVMRRLFEPLVTTKPAGVGLGLALVKRIADRHGGRVELTSGALGGVRFGVFFPNFPNRP